MTTRPTAVAAPPSGAARARWASSAGTLDVYAVLALAYLFLPIAVVVLFSFNNPAGRFNYTWQGFTLENWRTRSAYPGLGGAIQRRIEIALLVEPSSRRRSGR